MSIQEAALHGELVLYLRDRLAELLAGEDGNVEDEQERLDAIIREWFFTPQRDLHGCAPRELIWAERKGESNPVRPGYLEEFFVDDCSICQADLEQVRGVIEADGEPGWHWYYDGDGWPLIARYDPEGWEEYWVEEEAAFQERGVAEGDDDLADFGLPAGAAYEPFPLEPDQVSPEEFIARLRQPWLDPALHSAARAVIDRLDCPEPSRFGLRYRPISYDEALSLLVGLYEHGVDLEFLLAQIEIFPYQSVALDWLSRPGENAALMIHAMEHEVGLDDEAEEMRFRHHRDFILALSQVIPPGARLWLRGWLEAVAHGAFAHASREEADDVF